MVVPSHLKCNVSLCSSYMVEGKTTRQYLSSRTKKSRVQNFAKFWGNVQNLRNNIPVKCNTIKEYDYYFFLILKVFFY